jgi:hypothetical protein
MQWLAINLDPKVLLQTQELPQSTRKIPVFISFHHQPCKEPYRIGERPSFSRPILMNLGYRERDRFQAGRINPARQKSIGIKKLRWKGSDRQFGIFLLGLCGSYYVADPCKTA